MNECKFCIHVSARERTRHYPMHLDGYTPPPDRWVEWMRRFSADLSKTLPQRFILTEKA